MLIRAASLSRRNTLELPDFRREVVWGVARQQVASAAGRAPKTLVVAVKVQLSRTSHKAIYAGSEGFLGPERLQDALSVLERAAWREGDSKFRKCDTDS